MNYYEALRILALREVVNSKRRPSRDDGDPNYPLRKIFRAYSEKWSTPLPEVEALPVEEVLTHYYEDLFEHMEDDELKAAVQESLLDEDERLAAKLREDEEDALTYDLLQEAEQENRLADLAAATALAAKATSGLQGLQERPMRMGPEPELIPRNSTRPKPKTEEISMTFASEDEIDLDGGMFGLLSTPKTH